MARVKKSSGIKKSIGKKKTSKNKKSIKKNTKKTTLLARGGGNATASGVSFQASVAATIAVQLLGEHPVDSRLYLGGAKAKSIRFETEAPVDDILIETDLQGAQGWIFIQAKASLTNSRSGKSELGKTCDEIARVWEAAIANKGKLGWDRPLVPGHDAIVIAVGHTSSAPIKAHLSSALSSLRTGAISTLSQAQRTALDRLRSLLRCALKTRGSAFANAVIDDILKFVFVQEFDFEGGARNAAQAMLANVMEDGAAAPSAFAVLERECETLMAKRHGTNASDLRAALAVSGIALKAPATFIEDVAALRAHTEKTRAELRRFEEIRVNDDVIRIDRDCTHAVMAAAVGGPVVLVGDPGAGKSAVVNNAAEQLSRAGAEVVELAVDQLSVESLEGLETALALRHPIDKVLANWPGLGPGYFFIDGLDATRFGKSEAAFRLLISNVMKVPGGRWRVIASIRSFDLRLGIEFKRLFAGVPPNPIFIDSDFVAVRHIKIPEWSEVEFSRLLKMSPALATAIDSGGEKLRQLARVPFNSRLLAELISAGVSPEHFGELTSQVQLLDLFWQHRVGPLGSPAEQCLRRVVTAMVTRRRLQARKIDAGDGEAQALDQLLANNVLIEVDGGREIAFRHHILFDYAANRVFIDIEDFERTDALLASDKSLSLMLAPALSFSLQALWDYASNGRQRFWRAIIHFAGNPGADPVVRSVAARAACEFPVSRDDVNELVSQTLAVGATGEQAQRAFSHIVGALVARSEDKARIATDPWCFAAAKLSPVIEKVAWPLRQIVGVMLDIVTVREQREELGIAGRAILDYSLNTDRPSRQLAAIGIGFVAKTFTTDVSASRQLVKRLLVPEHMEQFADSDMHWLAQETNKIGEADPGLAVEIYRTVFTHVIKKDSKTSLGNSKILPMTSNRKQDFELAQWSLKEAYSEFLRQNPMEGVRAMTAVADAYVANEHTRGEKSSSVSVTVGTQTTTVHDDMSYIWAPNPSGMHYDNAELIVDQFVAYLRSAPEEQLIILVEETLKHAHTAWLWARIFMVGAEKGGGLSKFLWPWAIQEAFMRSDDMRKDALDLIKSEYPSRGREEKEAFERMVIAMDFSDRADPALATAALQKRIFGTIGAVLLVTPEAIAVAKANSQAGKSATNPRPLIITDHIDEIEGFTSDKYWWFKDKGVDVEASENAQLLRAVEACEFANAHMAEGDPLDFGDRVTALYSLLDAIKNVGDEISPLVVEHGWNQLSSMCVRLTQVLTNEPTTDPEVSVKLADLLAQLLNHPLPVAKEETEDAYSKDESTSGGVRVDAVQSALNLARLDKTIAENFAPKFIAAADDLHPEVRAAVAGGFNQLWETAPDAMWKIAERFASQEKNVKVLGSYMGFLNRVFHKVPQRVETLTISIIDRITFDDSEASKRLRGSLGSLIVGLWTSFGLANSLSIAQKWLDRCFQYHEELQKAAFSVRDGLVLGYGKDKPEEDAIRNRCQQFAGWLIEAGAAGVEAFMNKESQKRTEGDQERASIEAHLVDQMADQFFFASGAFKRQQERDHTPLTTNELLSQFVRDNEAIFRRVGDVGTPHAVHNLLSLLEFLLPGDPARVFDLLAHALLGAGRMHGYMSESLGADRFVALISLFLADYRELFDDTSRRLQLVECLEAFVEAGWPSARRLLYRLPELLR